MKTVEHSVSTAVVQPKVGSVKELSPQQHVWSETRQELTSASKCHGIACLAYLWEYATIQCGRKRLGSVEWSKHRTQCTSYRAPCTLRIAQFCIQCKGDEWWAVAISSWMSCLNRRYMNIPSHQIDFKGNLKRVFCNQCFEGSLHR